MNRRARRDLILLTLPGLVLVAAVAVLVHGGAGAVHPAPAPTFSRFVGPVERGEAARSGGRPGASAIELAEAGDRPPAEFYGETPAPPLLPDEYRLTLVDDEGRPIPHARIRVVERPNFHVSNAANEDLLGPLGEEERETDEDGELAIMGSAGSIYELVVELDGFARKRYRLRDPGRRLVRLHRTAVIAGKVYDHDGRPLDGIEIKLSHDGDPAFARTDGNGYYEFPSVTPELTTLMIRSPFYERRIKHVTVEGGSRYTRDFYLRPGGVLDLVVHAQDRVPVSGAGVSLIELNAGLDCGRTVTDNAGRVRYGCLRPERSYMIVASAPDYGTTRQVFQTGASDDFAGELAVVERRVELTGTWTMSGVVTASGLGGVPDARVVLESDAVAALHASRHQVAARTDAQGGFEATGLLVGRTYTAFVYHPQFRMEVVTGLTQGASQGQLVTLPVSPTNGDVQGVIYGDDGRPMPNALVYLRIDGGEPGVIGSRISIRTDSMGRYVFPNLPNGRVFLQVIHRGRISSPATIDVAEAELQPTTDIRASR